METAFFTTRGREELELAEKIGMSEYYDPMAGIYTLPWDVYTEEPQKFITAIKTLLDRGWIAELGDHIGEDGEPEEGALDIYIHTPAPEAED